MVITSCITVSAQVKYEGINGSFDGMMCKFMANLNIYRERPGYTMFSIPGKKNCFIILYKGSNGRIKRLTERYLALCRADAVAINNDFEDKIMSYGLNPKRIKNKKGEPQDLFRNRFSGGNYCNVVVCWPVALDDNIYNSKSIFDDDAYCYYLDVSYYPTVH